MRKQLLLCFVAIACVAFVHADLSSNLADQFRNSAPAEFAAIGSYVQNIQNVAQAETLTLTTAQIAANTGTTKTLNTYAGAYTFTPFQDLGNLRFGTSYTKLHSEHTINIPGACFSKITGSTGTRSGTSITLRAAFGVSVGTGVQLNTVTQVKKCKKRLFRKQKCWMENVSVPRGVTPEELQSVTQGLDNKAHMAIASAVTASNGNPITTGYVVPAPPKPHTHHHKHCIGRIIRHIVAHHRAIHVHHKIAHVHPRVAHAHVHHRVALAHVHHRVALAHLHHRVAHRPCARHVAHKIHAVFRRGRRLSLDTKKISNLITHTVQELKGVPKASIVDAVHSMIGHRVDLDKAKLFVGKMIKKGSHLIQALREENGFTIKVDTLF